MPMKREWGKYTDENIAFGELKSALETALGRELREDEAKSVKWLAGAGWDTVGRFVDMFKEIATAEKCMNDEMKQLKDEIWKKVFHLTVDIEYVKGYEKKFLLGKFEAFKEVWELLGGDVIEENV
jgi:hypothetical protein